MSTPARFLAREAGRMLNLPPLRRATPPALARAWAACFPGQPLPRRHGAGPALLSLAEARRIGAWLQLQQQATTRQP